MKWLEELLNDVDGKESLIKDIKSNLAKEFVPKTEFNNKIKEVKELKSQVEDRDNQLTELKEKAKGNDDLIKTIEDLELENKETKSEYETKLTNLQKKQIASKVLMENKARDLDVILKLVNFDDYELSEDGKELVGFSDKLKEHKENYSYLYADDNQQKQNSDRFTGFRPIDSSGNQGTGEPVSLGELFAQKKNKQHNTGKNSLWD